MSNTYNRVLINLGNIPMREWKTDNGGEGFCRDGSFIPYIVEELISRSAYQVVFDYGPEAFQKSIPKSIAERIGWSSSINSMHKALDYLAPVFEELNVGTNGRAYWPKDRSKDSDYNGDLTAAATVASDLESLLMAIDEKLQLDLDLVTLQRSLFHLRNILRSSEGRARIAVMQGIVNSYKSIDAPGLVALPTASEVIVEHFQRLVCDAQFLELSENASELGYLAKSKRAIELMRRNVGDILNNKLFSNGFNQGAKAISLATQIHIPETEVAESLLSRGYLPPIVSLVEPLSAARKLWESHAPALIPPRDFGLEI